MSHPDIWSFTTSKQNDMIFQSAWNYVQDDWHLFEQIDRTSGQQYNAKDVTREHLWSTSR